MASNPTFYVNKFYLILVSKKRFSDPQKFVDYLGKNTLPDIKKEHTKILHDDDCFYPVKNSFKKDTQPFHSMRDAAQFVEDRLIPENHHVMVVHIQKSSMEIVNLQHVPAVHVCKPTKWETTKLRTRI